MNYKNCHKILKYLYDEWNENNQQETVIGSIKIATKTNIPIAEIHELQHILINKGEVTFSGNDGQSMLSIQQNGIAAVVDRKYIKEGRKKLWDGIFDWARIILPLGAIVVSIIAILVNMYSSKKLSELDNRVKKLEIKK
ncbi:hypothetical protein [Chryseobacterium sediminis]|uniref:hypothetical protein n=1 Tax=Chryseobacterium sediminis TaxID=1679494 RepID=UPI00285B0481|nr:hypothetical protein [Chryseobacterium sediminis]MDR6461907.1 hypothetical protein [Chryseobacterium sediminis]